MKVLSLSVAAATVLCMAAPAQAHHSFAMFDRTKDITIEGTVKDWQFANPHGYLQVLAKHGTDDAEWSLETFGIAGLLRKGMRRETYKPGDKVVVVLHPLRNGAAGGELVSVTTADGVEHKF